MAALFGFFAYATYDLMNLATLKQWPIELQPLSAINAVFERLAKGEVPSRVVLDFSG